MEVTPELAELFGAYVGDGTMSIIRSSNGKHMLMSIAASKEERRWLDHIADLFERTFRHRPKTRWNFNVYKIQLGVGRICKFFREAGFPVGEKTLIVRAPSIIMNTIDGVVQRAFLRGYFDADGCLSFERRSYGKYGKFKSTYHYYPRVFLTSTSRDLIHTDIRKILESIGFRYSVYERMPTGNGEHKVYTATLRGPAQLNLWMGEVGSSNPVHLTKYEVWNRFGFCPSGSTLDERLAMLSGKLDPQIFYENPAADS